MSVDIVDELRHDRLFWAKEISIDFEVMAEAADEIERLRAERLEWFMVARLFMSAVTAENGDTNDAVDQYLRSRGRLEDPRG